MELDVPLPFVEVTQCFACETLQDGTILVGICTTSNQLLELVDKKVTEACNIDTNADEISIFTSYNPVQKFYLIRSKKKLLVVKRGSPLCIIKTYDNIAKVEIKDRLLIGRPQTVIWTITDNEPIVTDFVGQLHSTSAGPQPVPQLTCSLSGKLQEMNLRLARAQKILQEKRKARIDALNQLIPHLQPPDQCQLESEPMVVAWGPPPPEIREEAPPPPLQLSPPWQRVYNNKWVVGLPVFNSTDS